MNICWIKLRKNGAIEKESTKEKNIPTIGSGRHLNNKNYEVVGVVHTPHLDCVKHIFVNEI